MGAFPKTKKAGEYALLTSRLLVNSDNVSFSSSAANTLQEATALKSQPNMKVIAIGIGSGVNTKELNNIASDPQHMFTVANFDVLNKLNSELTFTSCQSDHHISNDFQIN